MTMETENTFIRELDLDLQKETVLKLHQKIEGDVSCVVWDAAIILAKYLEKLYQSNHDFFKKLKIIELGAGVGCVGLTAACLGGTVTLTDLPEAVPLLKLNVETNKSCWEQVHGYADVSTLVWGEEVELKWFPDLILLADCIYYKESIDPLFKTLKELVGSHTEILLCQEIRDTAKQRECWELFIKTAKEAFSIHIIPIEEQHSEFSCPDIVILKLKKL
ncbi:unnamed protein product [Diabrotica balteata]|uniref:Uncharacterized protein n=1 Tax=Diabrotica balteata TaxID=107213 RepID=A0A9N9T7E2_DIABA|nr:unnamed protein product [Diabrotica balteata]